jgi:anti-sigma factor RsiW
MRAGEQVMAESERLMHRFLDQELTAEERVRFVVRLGRDEGLRQKVVELEELLGEAARLPRAPVPEGFAARVMNRIDESTPPDPWWRRLGDALLAPRSLRWNFATAAACFAVFAAAIIIAERVASRASPVPQTVEAPVSRESTSATVLVRLIVVQPGARIVEVAGDFNGWNPARTPLEPAADGAWTVTIPLQPGRYEYMFVVDGSRWIADPFAAERNSDGFGSENAVLDVRPAAAPL